MKVVESLEKQQIKWQNSRYPVRFLVTKTTGSGHTGWHTAKAAQQRTGKINNSITGGATIFYSFGKKEIIHAV